MGERPVNISPESLDFGNVEIEVQASGPGDLNAEITIPFRCLACGEPGTFLIPTTILAVADGEPTHHAVCELHEQAFWALVADIMGPKAEA